MKHNVVSTKLTDAIVLNTPAITVKTQIFFFFATVPLIHKEIENLLVFLKS